MSSDNQELTLFTVNRRFYEAFSTLDIEEMSKIWEHSERVHCIHPGWPLLSGWEIVRKSWETIFSNTTLMHFALEEVKITVQGECGWVDCIENITSVIDGAAASFAIQTTNIYTLEDDTWLMVHHHGSAHR